MTIYVGTTDLQQNKITVVTYDGLGVLAEEVPASGTHGAAYAYPSLSFPDDTGKEIRGEIVSDPVVIAGVGQISSFFAYEDTSFDLTVTDDCTVRWYFDLWVDGQLTSANSGIQATVIIGADSNAITLESANFSDGAQSDGAFSITVTVPAAISDGAQSGDTKLSIANVSALIADASGSGDNLSSIARVTSQISEQSDAGDNSGNSGSVLQALTEAGQSDEITLAIAQATTSISDAVQSGEQWVDQINAIAILSGPALSADSWQRIVDGIGDTSVTENSESASSFLAAIRTIGVLSNSATSGDALAVTCSLIGILSSGAQSADAWTAVDQGIISIAKNLLAAASSAGSFISSLSVSVSMSEGAVSDASFVAPDFGATGFLVASAITLTAQMTATLNLEPKLSVTNLTLEPNS